MSDMDSVIAAHKVSHVIITFSLAPDAEMRGLMQRCKDMGAQVLVVPRLYEEMTHRLTIEHLGAIPLIRVERPDPRGWQFTIKYTLDRVAAAVLLMLLAPLLAGIALLVRLTSNGPTLFRQQRVGLDGREFTMLKFRSMRGEPDEAADSNAKWAAMIRGEPADQALALTDRTTAFGRIMRKISLDELPQLFNVLRGQMSLVGPRPERVELRPGLREPGVPLSGPLPRQVWNHRLGPGPEAAWRDRPRRIASNGTTSTSRTGLSGLT